jgi:hypothetical protein
LGPVQFSRCDANRFRGVGRFGRLVKPALSDPPTFFFPHEGQIALGLAELSLKIHHVHLLLSTPGKTAASHGLGGAFQQRYPTILDPCRHATLARWRIAAFRKAIAILRNFFSSARSP